MKELTQKELVTIALFLLGGDKKSFDTEDVAVKASEIAPGKFSWKKYPEFIDQELVRRSILAAKQDDKFVVGSQKKGWMLSSSGFKFAKVSVTKKWAKPVKRESIEERKRRNREKERLMSSEAYEIYSSGDSGNLDQISYQMACEFFRLDDYVKGEAREKKIERISNSFLEDKELSSLVVALSFRVRKGA